MNLTPQPADQFSRFMSAHFDDRQSMPAPGGFCTFFGRPENGSQILFSPNSEVADIDIIRGNEKLAALIPRGLNSRIISGQKNTQEQNSTNISRVFPLIEEEGAITASQLNKALAGESRYNSGTTRFDRMRELVMIEYFEQMRRQTRTYELLSSLSIITGVQPAILGTTNLELLYDFRRSSENFITVSTAWSDVASDILGDVDSGCDTVRRNGRANPDMMILSSTDIDSLLKNTAAKEVADNRRFELIEVTTNNPVPDKFADFVANGFTPRGRLRTPSGYVLWMFTYIEGYNNDAGDWVPFLPDNKTVICSTGARCDANFGPPELLPLTTQRQQWINEMFGFNLGAKPMPHNFLGTKWQQIMPAATYVDAYPSSNEKSITVRSQSAPIFSTTQTDAFVTITTTP